MASISVEAVTSRRQEDRFLDLPHDLYARDGNWVPPVRSVQRFLLGYVPHPFCKSAKAQTFLAIRNGSVCGRIAAILRGKRQIECLRVLAANVAPEYQRLGIPLVLLCGVAAAVLKFGVENVEFSWILESNRLSRGSLEKGGAKLVKRYRVYGWTLQDSRLTSPDKFAALACGARKLVSRVA